MGQEIQITLSLQSAQALAKMAGFVDNAAGQLKRLASEALALTGITAGVYGLERLAEATVKLGASLEILQRRAGGTIPEIMAIRRAITDAGGSADSAAGLMFKMQAAIGQAIQNGGPAERAIESLNLGLTLQELAAKNATAQFMILATAISNIENASQRAYVMRSLFGRGAGELSALMSRPMDFSKSLAGEQQFAAVMARDAETFHLIEEAFARIKEKGVQIMTGFLDQFAPAIERAVTALSRIDFTPIGQRIGAMVELIIQSFRDNKFPELLSLLIEAGFEIAGVAIQKTWRTLWTALTGETSGQLTYALLNAVLTFGTRSAQLFLRIFQEPVIIMAGSLAWFWDKMEVGFDNVVLYFKQALFTVLNEFIDQFNTIVTVLNVATLGRINLGGAKSLTRPGGAGKTGISIDEAMAMAEASGVGVVSGVNRFLEERLAQSREILQTNLGVNASDNVQLTALQRLKALTDEIISKREAHHAKAEAGENGGDFGPSQAEIRRLQQYIALQDTLYKQQVANINANPFLSGPEKAKQIIAEIDAQQKLVLLAYQEAKAQYDSAQNQDDKLKALQELTRLQGQYQGMGNQRADLATQFSVGESLKRSAAELVTTFGTVAQQIGNLFKTVINTSISTVSSNLTAVIMKTKSWGAALMDIGTTMLSTIIQGIIEMGAKWVLQHVIMRGAMVVTHALGVALGWSATTQTIAQEEAKAPALAVNAANSSVSSYGASAIVGVALAIAAIGAILAATMAREQGGPVTAGRAYVVGEKRPELFVPTQNGYIMPSVPSPSQSFASSGGQSPVMNISVHNWNDEAAMTRHIRDNPETHHVLLDKMKRNAHIIGARP